MAENEVLIRNLVSTILSNAGYLVLAAANPLEAQELSRTFIGEIRLLIAKSRELAASIATERPGIHVIVLSPCTSLELKEIVRKVHPGAFLQQARLPQKLSECIQRALTDPDFGNAFVEV
jgi:DNA-binding NtrC family response regulator